MPHPETPGVTEDNSPFTEDMLGTLHRMAHQVDEMYKVLAMYAPMLEAYSRGGILAARTVARRKV
jgi:hypothetical protein